MAERPLYDNSVIESAINTADGKDAQEANIDILEAIRLAMNCRERLAMPINLTEEALARVEFDENGAPLPGSDIDPNRDFTLKTIHRDDDDADWLVGFTSEKEYAKGPESLLFHVPFANILPRIANISDVNGVIINPWGLAYPLSRENIVKMLRVNQPQNRIFFNLGDITELECDAIVNAANRTLLGGGGVDGAIHKAAGPRLKKACRALNGCQTGEAKITKGYDLKARYVIHTVGPVYGERKSDASELANCYLSCLELARAHNIHSIAFPAISTGAYGYPADEAAAIALDITSQWLEQNMDYGLQVIFCCYSQEMLDVYETVLAEMTGAEDENEQE